MGLIEKLARMIAHQIPSQLKIAAPAMDNLPSLNPLHQIYGRSEAKIKKIVKKKWNRA